MTKSATTRCGRSIGVAAVGSVRNILPFSVSKLLVIFAETHLFPHDEYGREIGRNEASVLIEDRFAVTILLHRIAFKKKDRPVREVKCVPVRYRRGDRI